MNEPDETQPPVERPKRTRRRKLRRLDYLTPEVRQKLLENIRTGVSLEIAAIASGVPSHIVDDWIRVYTSGAASWGDGSTVADDDHEVLRALFHGVDEMENQARQQALNVIQEAARKGDRKAARWLRTHNQERSEPPPT